MVRRFQVWVTWLSFYGGIRLPALAFESIFLFHFGLLRASVPHVHLQADYSKQQKKKKKETNLGGKTSSDGYNDPMSVKHFHHKNFLVPRLGELLSKKASKSQWLHKSHILQLEYCNQFRKTKKLDHEYVPDQHDLFKSFFLRRWTLQN